MDNLFDFTRELLANILIHSAIYPPDLSVYTYIISRYLFFFVLCEFIFPFFAFICYFSPLNTFIINIYPTSLIYKQIKHPITSEIF